MDVDAFALHNAFEMNHPDAMRGVIALLNIGNEVTNLNILDDGVPILPRDLTVGTRRFREDLQREHGLASDAAEAMLRGFDRNPTLDAVVSLRGEELAVGIERAATFLSPHHHARLGRSARSTRAAVVHAFRGSLPWLADRLRLPVQHANPLARLTVRDGAMEFLVHGRSRTVAHAPGWSRSSSSGLRTSIMMIEINLLPGAKKSVKGGAPRVNVGEALTGFKDKIKDPWLIGSITTVVIAVASVGILFTAQQARANRSRIENSRLP